MRKLNLIWPRELIEAAILPTRKPNEQRPLSHQEITGFVDKFVIASEVI